MKALLGTAAPTKKVDFLGQSKALEIRKLTGLEVKAFQAFMKDIEKLPEDDRGLAIQRYIIRVGVVDAGELSDEELDSFPLQDVSELAKSVLSYSGINAAEEKGNG